MRGLPPTRWLVVAGVGVACAIAAALIAISLAGSGDDEQAPPTSFAIAGLRALAGIPERGQVLGSRSAPVRLVEYADLQCPLCAGFATGTLPTLVREYVRPGKVSLELRPIAFIGPDSPTGVRAVVAAGLQNRAWQLAELLFENQGAENGGWLTGDFVIDAARAIPGLDVGRFERDLDSSTVSDIASATGALAKADGVDETPFFLVGKRDEPPRPLHVSLDAAAFRAELDALLR